MYILGVNSGLHIIIFDEIDAICKTRGSVAGNTGVNDTVVNQLLSKIDGVDQLNNILVIGNNSNNNNNYRSNPLYSLGKINSSSNLMDQTSTKINSMVQGFHILF